MPFGWWFTASFLREQVCNHPSVTCIPSTTRHFSIIHPQQFIHPSFLPFPFIPHPPIIHFIIHPTSHPIVRPIYPSSLVSSFHPPFTPLTVTPSIPFTNDLTGMGADLYRIVFQLYHAPEYYLIIIFVVILCLWRDVTWKFYSRTALPQSYHIVQELQALDRRTNKTERAAARRKACIFYTFSSLFSPILNRGNFKHTIGGSATF